MFRTVKRKNKRQKSNLCHKFFYKILSLKKTKQMSHKYISYNTGEISKKTSCASKPRIAICKAS